MEDFGPQIIDAIFESLDLEARWAIRSERGLTWWPHELAQRVWAEPLVITPRRPCVRIHVETDLLRGAGPGEDFVWNEANHVATLGAIITEHEDSVRLHSTFYIDPDSLHLMSYVKDAMALQAERAEQVASGPEAKLGGGLASSEHPESGGRPDRDALISVPGYWRSLDEVPPLSPRDFDQLLACLPKELFLATGGGLGVTAEVSYNGGVPFAVQAGLGWEVDSQGSSLIRILATEENPVVGRGILVLLELPITLDPDDAVALAMALNTAEITEWTSAAFPGAWSASGRDVCFSQFLPTPCMHLDLYPEPWWLLQALMASVFARSQWVCGANELRLNA